MREQSGSQGVSEGWEWAIVEVMGHRRHAGRIREEEKFGAKMLRVDIPIDGDVAKGWVTHLYSAGALFSLRYCDEATVYAANRPNAVFRIGYEERGRGEGGLAELISEPTDNEEAGDDWAAPD